MKTLNRQQLTNLKAKCFDKLFYFTEMLKRKDFFSLLVEVPERKAVKTSESERWREPENREKDMRDVPFKLPCLT